MSLPIPSGHLALSTALIPQILRRPGGSELTFSSPETNFVLGHPLIRPGDQHNLLLANHNLCFNMWKVELVRKGMRITALPYENALKVVILFPHGITKSKIPSFGQVLRLRLVPSPSNKDTQTFLSRSFPTRIDVIRCIRADKSYAMCWLLPLLRFWQ